MRVVVSDLFVGDCELTQKSGCEVACVQLDGQPETVIAASELIRWLRFTKKQLEKVSASGGPDVAGRGKGPKTAGVAE